jgi:hypothetical protein
MQPLGRFGREAPRSLRMESGSPFKLAAEEDPYE